MQLIHVGRIVKIRENFEEKFGISISRDKIYDIKKNKEYEATYIKLKEEYEKGLAKEYMVSKRNRISAKTEIYEEAMEKGNLAQASKEVKDIDDMLEKRATFGVSGENVQINLYQDMKLDEIREEKLKLLEKLEKLKGDPSCQRGPDTEQSK